MRLLTLLLALVLVTGCNGDTDYYAQVAGPCGYTSQGSIAISSAFPKARLKHECKTALEAVLPYDHESFANAPDGFKDKITEAFQAVVAYPLAFPPENRIMGVAPWSIPLGVVERFREDSNANRALFNHLMEVIHTIVYAPNDGDSGLAAYPPPLTSEGKLIVYEKFLNVDLFAWNSWYTGGLRRAAVLIHEARHADGYFHVPCSSSGNDFACDSDLNGPYGLEYIYLEMALHGGYGKHLGSWDVLTLATDVCQGLQLRIELLPPELKEFISAQPCASRSVDWYIDQLGLKR